MRGKETDSQRERESKRREREWKRYSRVEIARGRETENERYREQERQRARDSYSERDAELWEITRERDPFERTPRELERERE